MWLSKEEQAQASDLLDLHARHVRQMRSIVDAMMAARKRKRPDSLLVGELIKQLEAVESSDQEAFLSLVRLYGCHRTASLLEEEYKELRECYEVMRADESRQKVALYEKRLDQFQLATEIATTLLRELLGLSSKTKEKRTAETIATAEDVLKRENDYDQKEE
jgi:hypothetical protein